MSDTSARVPMVDQALVVQGGYGKGWPFVKGCCPACGARGLFVGAGGYLTCSAASCPAPAAPSVVIHADFERADSGDPGSRP